MTRYKETRRSHPLAATGLPLEGIALERQLLEELKGRSQLIYDTSDMKPRDLREKIVAHFATNQGETFTVNVMSFGFKYGLPIDADLVFDVRFLPNPFYIESMRPLTGKDEEVSSYVMKWNETQSLLKSLLICSALCFRLISGKVKASLSSRSAVRAASTAPSRSLSIWLTILKRFLYSCHSPGH